jgi:hypothetical protein
MQGLTAGPRAAFTQAEVIAAIRDNPYVHSSAGLELVDLDLNVLADISDRLETGEVQRNSYATTHETCGLAIVGELDWGQALLRPYYNLHLLDGRVMRFNLGAYFTIQPEHTAEQMPRVYDVEGVGILDMLDDPVGDSYAVPAGVSYITAAEDVLRTVGYRKFNIEQLYTSQKVLAAPRTWTVDENPTWLGIVNDLLGAVGYQGIYQDPDGVLVSWPYVTPSTRRSEWTYDTGTYTAMILGKRAMRQDLYKAPNRWVFVRDSDNDDGPRTEGNGRYTYVNQSDGPTSVDARGGRVITKGPIGIEAADQEALVQAAQVTIDADKRPNITVPITTTANPLHWHFDRLTMNDPDLGPIAEVLSTEWRLPLDGGNMAHSWSVLA